MVPGFLYRCFFMLWSNIFSRPAELTVSEVRTALVESSADRLQLVDVRQQSEYKNGHLPGALLIPLNELENRFQELDPSLQTIVYCRSGARSATACQMLEQRGFASTFNMKGGILAWQGQRVIGDEEAGLGYFLDGDYANVYELACNLEVGLQRFYQLLADRAADEGKKEVAALLEKMAQFEDGHIAHLTALHNKEYPDITLQLDARFAEGGISLESLIAAFGSNLDSIESVLQLAMSFEAQALDLYFRLGQKTADRVRQQFFDQMVKEERGHLRLLAVELDRLTA